MDSEELTPGPGALEVDVLIGAQITGESVFPPPIPALVAQASKNRDAAQRATQSWHLGRGAHSTGGTSDVPLIFIFHF